jgi:TonB family protein
MIMHLQRIGVALMMLACVVGTQSLDARGKKSAKKPEEPPPACPATFNDSPETNGVSGKVGRGSGIAPPRLLQHVEAEFSDEARAGYRSGKIKQNHFVSVLSFVVDKDGNPTEICLKTAAGYGLDGQAAKAVRQYRFDPANKDGQPVAARITTEVSFQLF